MGNRHIQNPSQFANELKPAESSRHQPRDKRGMDRLRKSLRESFRRKKDHIPESSKPHQWQADEQAVRMGNCTFPVKYLGCVEVFESRGMQICEEALRVLRNSRRRPIKGILYVTGDGLRVVDDETKGLLVDQTIEKVSFCAPDRNHEKGFSYICRDGTTRRWMTHGFHAVKDSGERLSHAVGCAFAVCLERKQKRDKESVSMNFDPKTSTFTRTGSFRQTSITERLHDPQDCKPTEPPPLKQPVSNPHAIERPHATPSMLQRQGSFRGFNSLNQASPFKRQLSLRVNDLPSNSSRQRAHSLESSDLFSVTNGSKVAPIPEVSPVTETNKNDTISAFCQELSAGLSFLSNTDDPFVLAPKKISPSPLQSNQQKTAITHGVLNTESFSNKDSKLMKTTIYSTDSNWSSRKENSAKMGNLPYAPPRRSSPNFSQLRSQSLSIDTTTYSCSPNISEEGTIKWSNGSYSNEGSCLKEFKDPFDAEWAALATRHESDDAKNTNPFTQSTAPIKAFEVQM